MTSKKSEKVDPATAALREFQPPQEAAPQGDYGTWTTGEGDDRREVKATTPAEAVEFQFDGWTKK